MWSQMILPQNPIQRKILYTSQHSKQDSASVAPLRKYNSVHQDDPTKTTILNEQFQSVFSRKSPNSLSFFCHMKRQESTDADISMLDITVTSKGIENNLNPHKAADPDQIIHWRRLDQRRIDNKLSLMYKTTHNLIAIPISDFLTLSHVVLQADNCYG